MKTQLLATSLLALSVMAVTQAQDLEGSAAIDAVLACQSQTDDMARLACQDAAIERLAAHYSSGELAVVERSQVSEAQKDGFGLNLAGLSRLTDSLFSRDNTSRDNSDDESDLSQTETDEAGVTVERNRRGEIRQLTGLAISRVDEGPRGKLEIHLENGQVWQQMDNTYVRVLGDYETAEIVRRSLGSYYMRLNNQSRFFRVEREK